MFYKYPFTKQKDSKDCAPSSLQMIIKYYKGYIGVEKLRDLMKTNNNGTNAYNLIEAAKKLGFEASGVKTTLEDINEENLILPAIAHVIINNSYTHFIVIYKIDYKKKIITIADPADKIKKISFDEFKSMWSNILVILFPKSKLIVEKDINLFKFINNILSNHKILFVNIVILSLFILFFTIIISFYFQIMIDYIYKENQLINIFLIFLAITLLKIITILFRTEVLILLKQKIDFSLTLDTIKHIIYLPYQYYKNRSTGDIVSRFNDMESIKEIINKGILTVIDLPLGIISLIILYLFNVNLFLISIFIIIIYLFLTLLFRKFFISNINDYQIKKSLLTTSLIENIQAFETVKGLNIQKNMINLLEQKYSNLITCVYKIETKYNLQNFFKNITNEIGNLFIILIGLFLVKDNVITLGMLITFNTLSSYFIEPLKSIIDLDYNLKESKNSLERIVQLFDNYEIKEIKKEKINGDIKINNLSYAYDYYPILKNINLNFKKGEKTLIIGNSGSGKSTLLKLIMKYYKVDRNKILIDDIDINEINTDEIVYISQNELLFTDSLINNLKLNRNIDLKNINGAIKLCYVDDIIKNNNLGLNMLIEENGFNLSGGERQRIVLARSILRDFEVLLIDEGLNQIDIKLEREILKNLFSKYYDKTIIIVSHRFDNIDLFDHIIDIKEGKIRKEVFKNV